MWRKLSVHDLLVKISSCNKYHWKSVKDMKNFLFKGFGHFFFPMDFIRELSVIKTQEKNIKLITFPSSNYFRCLKY